MSGVDPSPKRPQVAVPGTITTKKTAFTEDLWGGRAREWVKTAERLSSADWVEINAEVKVRIGILTEEGCTEGPAGTAGEASTAAGSTVDARACIEL